MQRKWAGFVLSAGLAVGAVAGLIAMPPKTVAQTSEGFVAKSGKRADLSQLLRQTNEALVEQIGCRHRPEPARIINAMLKNRLIRYVADENGIYLFLPTAPLTLFGMRITSIAGADLDGSFASVPASVMAGTAPPTFLEIVVAARADELRKRALKAGLREETTFVRGFQVSKDGYASYLGPKNKTQTSSIVCASMGPEDVGRGSDDYRDYGDSIFQSRRPASAP